MSPPGHKCRLCGQKVYVSATAAFLCLLYHRECMRAMIKDARLKKIMLRQYYCDYRDH